MCSLYSLFLIMSSLYHITDTVVNSVQRIKCLENKNFMSIHTRPVTLLTAKNRVEFLVRGERFATYRYDEGRTPGFTALYASAERAVTQPAANDLALWLAHGNVNGIAFGTESPEQTENLEDSVNGTIVSLEMLTRRSAYSVGFQHECGWLAPNGKQILTDTRTVRVTPGPSEGAILDIQIALQAHIETPVLFGRSDSAFLSIRAASALTSADSFAMGAGQLRNSLGAYGAEEVHGRMAKWCACVGVVRNETVGFAFLEHPGNPFFPSPWVARPDGVLSPSPFAWRSFKLAAGENLTLRYRLLVHVGYVNQGWADARLTDFARENP